MLLIRTNCEYYKINKRQRSLSVVPCTQSVQFIIIIIIDIIIIYFTRATKHDKWSENCDKRPHRMPCRELNDTFQCNIPFVAYTAAETLNAFEWDGQAPKLSLPVLISTPSNTWSFGPTRVSYQTASRSVQPFFRAHERDQQTDKHTDHVVAIGRI